MTGPFILFTHTPLGRLAGTYPNITRQAERGNPVSLPLRGQPVARQTYGGAGLGYWKKRMPRCNGSDTGCNITRHESEPTSNWSYIARESVEPWLMRKSK
jgi:hypothetical protein